MWAGTKGTGTVWEEEAPEENKRVRRTWQGVQHRAGKEVNGTEDPQKHEEQE